MKKSERALIVDDEPHILEILEFELELLGFTVETAGNGLNALQKLEGPEPFSLLLSDLRMPGMDGFELISKVRATFAAPPAIVIMSGYAELVLEEIYDAGADHLLSKPFSGESLTDAVKLYSLPLTERWGDPLTAEHAPFQLPNEVLGIRLGRGGMAVALPASSPVRSVNDRVSFLFPLSREDYSRMLDGIGIVRWVQDAPPDSARRAYGIEFTHLAKTSRQILAEESANRKTSAFIPRTVN